VIFSESTRCTVQQ